MILLIVLELKRQINPIFSIFSILINTDLKDEVQVRHAYWIDFYTSYLPVILLPF